MKRALARAGGVGSRAFLAALALSTASLCLAPRPGGAQERPPAIRAPLADLDLVPATPMIGQRKTPAFKPLAAKPKAPPLPAEATSRHTLDLPDRRLAFTAKAGAVTFEDKKGNAVAEIGYFAYLLDGADPSRRPVTFAINGGPGAASAWLHLGAIGPWRLPISPDFAHPTAPADLLPNADTWLDFTDLVFIDPVGTGYTRFHGRARRSDPTGDAKDAKDTKDAKEPGSEEALKPRRKGRGAREREARKLREKFWSMQGDIASLAVFIKRWLEANGRAGSPKVFLGESYGGYRAPRVAQTLQEMPGFALNGIVLVSPALVSRNLSGLGGVLHNVAQFPSLAAAIAEAGGPVSAERLAAFERQATGPYLADLLAGPRDAAAIERLAERIAAVTGLDVDTVRHLGPRSRPTTFVAAVDRKLGRTYSLYDATAKRYAAYDGPMLVDSGEDLDGLARQLGRAMTDLSKRHLAWSPERPYHVRGVGVGWSWYGQESLSALRKALVRDPTFRVLIVHGYADLVTPYFRTKLLLDQMPVIGTDNRVRFEIYGGGHMFYSRDDARALFRKHGLQFFEEIR